MTTLLPSPLARVALALVLTLAGGCASRPEPEAGTPTASIKPQAPAQLEAPVPRATPDPSQALASNETQVGRYTTVAAEPDEADSNPMAVIAKVHLPRQVVHSVGDAVRYVLLRTGYQLAADASLDPAVVGLLALRLPDNQRVLGPYRVDVLLSVLMGRPFRLVADPATRLVRYELLANPTVPGSASSPTAANNR